MCVHFVWLSKHAYFIIPAVWTQDGFWDLLAKIFIIIFIILLVLCLETHGSMTDLLLRHASHLILPIFIIPVEHLALKLIKLKTSKLDQNYAVLYQVSAFNNEAFMLTFNVQWIAVCEQCTQLYRHVRRYKIRWRHVGVILVVLNKQ